MAESFNDFVAGWVGGAAGIIVGSPLDVLKARLQSPTHTRDGAWQTLRSLVKYEGTDALFKGVLAPVAGLAGLNAILFVSYGSLLRMFDEHRLDQALPFVPTLGQVYMAGCGAGIAGFLFTTPTELIKIQAQISRVPKSTWQVTREIWARNGARGLYQGGWITMIRDAPSYGVYFWVYEGMKRILEVDSTLGSSANAWKLLFAGGMAGAVSWTVIYPIDVVKSRLQMQVIAPSQRAGGSVLPSPNNLDTSVLSSRSNPGRSYSTSATEAVNIQTNRQRDRPYASIKDCITRSYKADGIGVFFRGLWPTILRGFPVNAVTFWVYEVTLEFLENL
ncbi:mitochondrial carrier domain-containing protein [Syncephalastrum racemosum]|uniref:Mitochondrial carrier domain-containing protein n=1 Tax=Syncephalastrum racemosum TaxID=13706 RepID=A0A1X2HSK3_SYNRA|nr:mitochondrial carrier domain-containing protein [Syncephalastrum racemosum]